MELVAAAALGKFIGAGLAAIGSGAAAIGVGNVAGNFLAGALRNHARRSVAFKQDSETPARYFSPMVSGLASHTSLRHDLFNKSNIAPAKVLRVMRCVRFGAAPEYTFSSGAAIAGVPSAFFNPLTW